MVKTLLYEKNVHVVAVTTPLKDQSSWCWPGLEMPASVQQVGRAIVRFESLLNNQY